MRRELATFLVVGSLTVLVDFLCYHLALNFIGTDVAKGFGFISGTVFAYFANKSVTFKNSQPAHGSWLRFAVLYTTTLALNVAINSGVLKVLNGTPRAVQVAFFVATGFSAVSNFIGMKYFVFRMRSA